MHNAISIMSHAVKKLCLAGILVAFLMGLTSVVVPEHAYADSPTYTMSVIGKDTPSNVAPGDSFTVSLTLENNENSQYTMYAMSATVRYNTNLLEVESLSTNNKIDVYTRDAGDGWTDAVLNFKASTLKGVTWDNGISLMDITFKALDEGSTSMMIQRANISNSTGMGRYACTCNDAVITIASSSSSGNVTPVVPSPDESEGTTEGVAAPEADPSTLEGDTSDTMTDEERAEYEATQTGTLATNSATDSSSNANGSTKNATSDSTLLDSSNNAEGQLPVLLYVLIGALIIAVIALVVGIVIHKRRQKSAVMDFSGSAPSAAHATKAAQAAPASSASNASSANPASSAPSAATENHAAHASHAKKDSSTEVPSSK